MGQIHGAPPHPERIQPVERPSPREEVGEEEGLKGGAGRVQRGERAENEGRGGESRGVGLRAEEGVYSRQAAGGARHTVVGGRETVDQLVPCRCLSAVP